MADVTKAYAPDKQFFLLVVKARIVAAAMNELGMTTVDGTPTKNKFQEQLSYQRVTLAKMSG